MDQLTNKEYRRPDRQWKCGLAASHPVMRAMARMAAVDVRANVVRLSGRSLGGVAIWGSLPQW